MQAHASPPCGTLKPINRRSTKRVVYVVLHHLAWRMEESITDTLLRTLFVQSSYSNGAIGVSTKTKNLDTNAKLLASTGPNFHYLTNTQGTLPSPVMNPCKPLPGSLRMYVALHPLTRPTLRHIDLLKITQHYNQYRIDPRTQMPFCIRVKRTNPR